MTDKQDDEGFAHEARKIEDIEASARKALELDRQWYSKPHNFRHIPEVPVDVCANCIYLIEIGVEVGVTAYGCVREGGPIFLDLDITTEHQLGEMADWQCDKFEWKDEDDLGYIK